MGADSDHDLEALAASFVGSTLRGVRYWETPCFGETIDDDWDPSGPHGVSHGVDLVLDDITIAVTWGKRYAA